MNLLNLILLLAFLSPTLHLMPGGQLSHSITPDNKKTARKMLKAVFPNSPLLPWQNSSQLIYYSTQVVAGTNYFLVYKWRPASSQKTQYRCFVVWKRLPGQTPAYQMNTEYAATTDNAQACKDCHAIGNSCVSPDDKKTSGALIRKGRSEYWSWVGGKKSTGKKPRAELNGKIESEDSEKLAPIAAHGWER
jgi:hypothetical protein